MAFDLALRVAVLLPSLLLAPLLLSLPTVADVVSVARLSAAAARAASQSFFLVPYVNGTFPQPLSALSPACPRSVTYARIQRYTGIDPLNTSAIAEGILWSDLSINSQPCLPSSAPPSLLSATRFLTTPSQPWLLEGRDNSPLACASYKQILPAAHLFTEDLPASTADISAAGLLPYPTLLDTGIFRGDLFVLLVFTSPDGAVRDPTTCLLRQRLEDEIDDDNDTAIDPQPTDDPGGAVCLSDRNVVRGVSVAHLRPTGDVIGFSHRDERRRAIFRRITVLLPSSNRSTFIEASPSHLVYLYRNPTSSVVVAARAVRIGHALVTTDGARALVTDVTNVTRHGVYAPLTRSGSLVVNGLRVSCYTDVVGHVIGHALAAPLRAVPWLPWLPVVDALRALVDIPAPARARNPRIAIAPRFDVGMRGPVLADRVSRYDRGLT